MCQSHASALFTITYHSFNHTHTLSFWILPSLSQIIHTIISLPMPNSINVAVIGAGLSGLTAARELSREGHRVVVFEKNHRIGGTWVYNPETESDPLGVDPNRKMVHSSVYLSMRTNLPRQLMGFLDYPFGNHETGDPRTFPGHGEVLRFLDRFADEFGIRDLTRFETEVVQVEPVEGRKDEWVVESKTRGSELSTREVFNAIVVCSGRFVEPKLAEISGIENWRGFQIHSHNYRVPDSFEGQVVVLIGLGPSGFDISKDIGTVAREVHIATRINPIWTCNMKFQDYANIRHHGPIRCVYEDGLVAFEDGSSVYADAIIHCTGYKFQFPFLKSKGIVSVEDNRVGPLYKHVFPPSFAPSISFIGLTEGGSLNVIELQCKWVARVLSGKAELPSQDEMMDSVEKYYQQMQHNGLPKQYTHSLRPLQIDYKHWLVAQCDLPALEEWRDLMYTECVKKFQEMHHNYKDQWDDDYWDAIIRTSSSS